MSEQTLPRHELIELVRFATLAPSGHNTQPWRFSVHSSAIRMYPDFSRRLPVVDPDDHELFISIGCALENLVIAARESGLSAEVEYFPLTEPQECLLVHPSRAAPVIDRTLVHTILERQSTRRPYDGRPIPVAVLRALEVAARQEGVEFRLCTDARQIEAITELVKEGGRRQFSDPAFVEELASWIRFSKAEVERHHDGIAGPVMGLPALPGWLGKSLMKAFTSAEGEAKRAENLIRSSSALMLFIAEENDRRHWVDLGRSFERVALTATSLNIKQAHLNMPCEVPDVRAQFQRYLGLDKAQPLLLLRVGYAESMPRSPRRPLQDVLIESGNGNHRR